MYSCTELSCAYPTIDFQEADNEGLKIDADSKSTTAINEKTDLSDDNGPIATEDNTKPPSTTNQDESAVATTGGRQFDIPSYFFFFFFFCIHTLECVIADSNAIKHEAESKTTATNEKTVLSKETANDESTATDDNNAEPPVLINVKDSASAGDRKCNVLLFGVNSYT